jgi:hypothetical protein
MKKMMLLLFLVNLFFSACKFFKNYEALGHDFKEEELKESVIRVELIDYNNPDAKEIQRSDNHIPFDFNKMTILEALDEAKIGDFIKSFCNYSYFYLTYHLDSPKGLGLRLVHKNGDFLLVCEADYSALFNKDGVVLEDYGSGLGSKISSGLKELVKKYFNYKM